MAFRNPYPDLEDILRDAAILELQVQPVDLSKPDDLKRYLLDLTKIQQAQLQQDEQRDDKRTAG